METGCGGRTSDARLGVVVLAVILEDLEGSVDAVDELADDGGRVGLVVADAVTATVSGLLRLFFNVFNSRNGFRKALLVYAPWPLGVPRVVVTVEVDLVEATDRMDDCEGDVLSFTVTSESALRSEGREVPVSGRSVAVRRGLSSMGGIFINDEVDMMEFLCESRVERLSVPVHEEAITVALPDEAKELWLMVPGFVSFGSAKASRSNFSASSRVIGWVRVGEWDGPNSGLLCK